MLRLRTKWNIQIKKGNFRYFIMLGKCFIMVGKCFNGNNIANKKWILIEKWKVIKIEMIEKKKIKSRTNF